MISSWIFTESKFPQVSRTLLRILADLNNAVVWMVSNRYFQVFLSLYQSFGDCTKNTNYNWYNRCFRVPQSFFQFPGKVQVLIILFAFFQFYSLVSRDSKVHNSASSLSFLLIIIKSGRLSDPFVSQNPRGVCAFSYTEWITLLTQSCIVSYTCCDNLLHSLMWLIGPSLSPHNLHLLFCYALSVVALIWLVLLAFFVLLLVLMALFFVFFCCS